MSIRFRSSLPMTSASIVILVVFVTSPVVFGSSISPLSDSDGSPGYDSLESSVSVPSISDESGPDDPSTSPGRPQDLEEDQWAYWIDQPLPVPFTVDELEVLKRFRGINATLNFNSDLNSAGMTFYIMALLPGRMNEKGLFVAGKRWLSDAVKRRRPFSADELILAEKEWADADEAAKTAYWLIVEGLRPDDFKAFVQSSILSRAMFVKFQLPELDDIGQINHYLTLLEGWAGAGQAAVTQEQVDLITGAHIHEVYVAVRDAMLEVRGSPSGAAHPVHRAIKNFGGISSALRPVSIVRGLERPRAPRVAPIETRGLDKRRVFDRAPAAYKTPAVVYPAKAVTDAEREALNAASNDHTLGDIPGVMGMAPAFFASIFPHRLKDFHHFPQLSKEAFGASRAIHSANTCLVEGGSAESVPPGCQATLDFISRSALAKAVFIKWAMDFSPMPGYTIDHLHWFLAWYQGVTTASVEQVNGFTQLDVSVMHASIIAAGPRGLDHAIRHPVTTGTNTYFPILEEDEEETIDLILPSDDPRWEDLPACCFLAGMVAPEMLKEIDRNGGFSQEDSGAPRRAYAMVTAAMEAGRITLARFLKLGPVATAFWVKYELCSLPPVAAARRLRVVEPQRDVLSPAVIEAACTKNPGVLIESIRSAMTDAVATYPIFKGISIAAADDTEN